MLLETMLRALILVLSVIAKFGNAVGLRRSFVNGGLVEVIEGCHPIAGFFKGKSEVQSRLDFLGRERDCLLILDDGGFAVARAFQRLAMEIMIYPTGGIELLRPAKIGDGGRKIFFQNQDAACIAVGNGIIAIQFLGLLIEGESFVVFFLGLQGGSKTIERTGRTWVLLNGQAIFFLCFVKPSGAKKGAPEALVTERPVWSDGSELTKLSNRCARIGLHQSSTEILASFEVVRITKLHFAV